MGAIATGVFKKVVFKKQSALKTIATNTAGQSLRRVSSTIDLKRQQYKSAEINASQQRKDSRLGVKSVEGSISGELSPGTYQQFMESVMRQAVQTGATSGALINVAAASSGVGTFQGTFTRAAGSFLTDGFKLGDLVRWTGWATTGVPNNATNMIIVALTATVMTCIVLAKTDVGAKIAGDSVTCALVGKKTWVPQSGHTRDYYTIEHNFADASPVISERFQDCVIGGMNLKLPASGMATVDFPVMGLDMTTAAAAYFGSPTAATVTGIAAAVNGALVVQGVKVATLTSLEINVTGNYSAPGGVVGDNVDPDIFPGTFEVSGNLTALFDSVTLRDYFINETDVTIIAALTVNGLATADAIVFVLQDAKFGGADKDDGEKGLSLSMPFMATEYGAGGAAVNQLQTTMSVQDTAFA